MKLFWAVRDRRQGDEQFWALPYGDLMSLLLVIFVMIASMSELRAGGRFDTVGRAVRASFGFSTVRESDRLEAARQSTLMERLEQAGLLRAGVDRGDRVGDEALRDCEVLAVPEGLIIRPPLKACFDGNSARLLPEGRRIVVRLAEFLVQGDSRLEVRVQQGGRTLSAELQFRDGLDLAYARGRAVLETLASAGIPGERLFLSAVGQTSSTQTRPEGVWDEGKERIEVIVHPVEGGT